VDIFRIFDALNDIRNMEFAIRVAKRLGAHVQGTICYTISPVHTIESFVELAKRLEELECDSLCIKDMAGLISPQAAHDLVTALKKEISIPIDLHSHCTSGMAPISYFAAIEAGVDIIDTAMSPFAWGTSQPPTESMVAALKGTPYDTGIDLEAFAEITPYFKEVRKRYDAIIEDISEMVDVNVLLYQIPGGMMSNLISQLKEQNALDRLPEVLEEVPRVRKDLGYPPLVTPTSQIVGTQAVMNVLVGERYKVVPKEVKDYVRGLYGRPPAPIDEEVKAKIIGDEEVITCRPADLLKPQLSQLREEAEKLGIIKKEEDLLTYALYPAIAVKFLRGEMREEPLPERREVEAKEEKGIPTEYVVEVDGEEFSVRVKPVGGFIEITQAAEQSRGPPKEVEGGIKAPMQGMIVKINVKKGDEVKKGDVVAVLEAMKMQNDVLASHDGRVEEIFVEEGANVSAGDVIMAVR
jgi:pyruvate carboxylase subunit B